ncbi:Rpn family recombination-promoting nuclease/putative transposase [Skermanella stibiiresistens]|uniref:Rpn family recombination-promoting nuclease/putative transposase n=1 Tax=Skermanella stibiiresistens TaxID=913326 RepID=UPI0018DAFB20|nr:Rpn family recombination-promoting nuclease/putative transposase [Skermanella stibiiresistens]
MSGAAALYPTYGYYSVSLFLHSHLARGGGTPLPPGIPLVICHGTKPWSEPPNYAGLYDVGPELRPFVPTFSYVLFDMRTVEDRDLSRDPFLRFGFAVMKLARGPSDFRRRLLALATTEVYRDDRMVQLLIYMINVYNDLDRATVELLSAPLTEEERGEVTTLAERLYADGKADGKAEGRAQGVAEGLAEGEAKGKAELLLDILEYRFGPVPNDVRARISRSDSDRISTWVCRAMEATSLDQVMNPEKG